MNKPTLRRRDFLKAVAATAAAPALARSAARGAAPAPRKLNIVMIVGDDQRYDTIAALGNDHIQTPALDRLARQGFAFTSARCMGSQQGAVCVPSRAAIHTGRTLFRVPDSLGDYATLGQTLLQAGYSTFGCGKWHNQMPSFVRSFNGGGNIFFGGMHDQYNTPVHDYAPDGNYRKHRARVPGKFSSELFADAAVEFLGGQKSADRPFFCYLAFTSPHDPRTPPPAYKAMYDPATMPLPDNFLPEHPFDNGELKIRDERLAPLPRTPANTKQQLCDYYGMVSSQDAQVGRVLAALEKSGRAEDTLVLYTGDHGLSIGSHGLFGKQSVYEEAARVPLLIAGPGIPKGRSDALVYGMDIFPTLCHTLGVDAPATVEGKSLAGIIAGKDTAVRDSSFHAYIHHNQKQGTADTQHAVNDGRWKYIRYKVKGQTRIQLFDLAHDPHEIHDVSADPHVAKEIERLAALLVRWQRDVSEPITIA